MLILSVDRQQLLKLDLLPIQSDPEDHEGWVNFRLEAGPVTTERLVLASHELYLTGEHGELAELIEGLVAVADGTPAFSFNPAERDFRLIAFRREAHVTLEVSVPEVPTDVVLVVEAAELRRFAQGLQLESQQLGFEL